MEKAAKFLYIFLVCILMVEGLASEESNGSEINKNTVYSGPRCQSENSGTSIKLIEMLFEQQTELLKLKSSKVEEMMNNLNSRLLKVEREMKESFKTLEEKHADDVKRLETFNQKHNNDVNQLEMEVKTLTSKLIPNVAFHARVFPSYQDLNPDQTILFEDVMTNLGNGFNPKTGIFHAPVSGTYVFSCTVTTKANSALELCLQLNNLCKMLMLPDARGKDGYDTSTNSVILHLKKGDQVKMTKHGRYGNKPFYINNAWSTFSGFLIHV